MLMKWNGDVCAVLLLLILTKNWFQIAAKTAMLSEQRGKHNFENFTNNTC